MKRVFVLLMIATITFSCSSSDKNISDNKKETVESTSAKTDISGKYTIFEVNGESLKDKDFGGKIPMLMLNGENMTYSTNIGCNQINGKYILENSTITFSPGMATMMACPDNLESEYVKALGEVDNYKVENFMLKVYQGDLLKIIFQPMKR